MSNLMIFNSSDFGNVRTLVDNDDKVYFVARDVAEILGYEKLDAMYRRLSDKQKLKINPQSIEKSGFPQIDASQLEPNPNIKTMVLITEGGLYKAIMGSILPSAEKFQDWVTDEVLPMIRKTGGYVNNDELFVETYLPFADETTKMLFKNTLEIVKKQNETIQIMQPKAEYFDDLVERNLLTNIRDTAKELKIKQKAFVTWLIENKYVYRDGKGNLKPYADFTPSLFEIKEFSNGGHAGTQTLVTPKGRETFRLLIKN